MTKWEQLRHKLALVIMGFGEVRSDPVSQYDAAAAVLDKATQADGPLAMMRELCASETATEQIAALHAEVAALKKANKEQLLELARLELSTKAPLVPEGWVPPADPTNPHKQYHLGIDQKKLRTDGKYSGVWCGNTTGDSAGTFWCGHWYQRTPRELEMECLTVLRDLRRLYAATQDKAA